MVTDATNQISEGDAEGNNTQFYGPKINIVNPQPNLQITNINAPSEVFLGQETLVEWTVLNSGSGATAAQTWSERIWLSLDNQIQSDQDILLGSTSNLNNLIADDSYQNSLLVTIPDDIAETNYYLIAETDYTNTLSESVETDNLSSTLVQVAPLPPEPKPDLQVTQVQAPNRAISGYDITVSYDVTNFGSVATPLDNWIDALYLSSDDTLDVTEDLWVGNYQHEATLGANQSVAVETVTVTIPDDVEGDFYLFVETDVDDQINEDVFESNNVNYDNDALTVYATLLPDLEIDLSSPAQVRAGETLNINYQIQNNGLEPTPDQTWQQEFYLSQSATLDVSSATYLGVATYSGTIARGEQIALSFETIIDYELEGLYYLHGITDSEDQIVEIFEDNNSSLATDFIEVTSTPPDLVVSNVTVINTADAGETVNVSWRVTNQGSGDTFSDSWVDAIYWQDAAGNPRLLTTVAHQGLLNAGEFYDQSQTVTIPGEAEGNYSFYVITDFSNQIFEKTQEGNNQSLLQPITIIRTLPDLVVDLVELSPDTEVTSGSTITVNWQVTNQGEKATVGNTWIDRIYLKDDAGNETLLKTVTHQGNLSPNTSYTASSDVELGIELNGNYEIFVETDSFNSVEEVTEGGDNRSALQPIAISRTTPDLVVTITDANQQGEAGKSTLVSWQVTNQGTQDSIVNSWVDRVYLVDESDNRTLLSSFIHTGPLDQGESYTRQESIQLPVDVIGDYRFLVETDSTNQVVEVDAEANNESAFKPFSITRNSADLEVTDVTFNPSGLGFGETLSVNWEVTNSGSAPTSANYWYDSVYLSRDTSYSQDDIYIGQLRRSNLLLNDNRYQATEQFTVPGIEVDNYHVIVRTDSSNLVFEPDMDDNNDGVSSNQVAIAASTQTGVDLTPPKDPNNPDGDAPNLPPELVPDLVVTDVSVGDTELVSNQTLEVTWTVENQRYPAGDRTWFDTIYLSSDLVFNPDTAIAIGSRLATGDSYTKTESFLLPFDLAGDYYVHVLTDSNDRITEVDAETNNTNSAPSPIQISAIADPTVFDLVVEDITFDQTQVDAGDTLTVTYSIVNQGVQAISGGWVDAVYLSEDDQWDVNDVLLGKVTHDGGIDAQGSYSESLTALVPGLRIGDYSVIVRSDIQNQVPEADELNNRSTSDSQVNIDVPLLTIGTPVTGTLAEDQGVYYRLEVEAGESLLVNFDSNLAEGFNELYISYEDAPTRGDYDFRYQEPFETDQEILIPTTDAGTYYLFAYGNDVPSASSYTLSTETIDFAVFDKSYGIGGTAGNRTIEINGNKFDRNVTARLVDQSGFELEASQYYWSDSTKFYATFDLTQASSGIYDVALINSTGEEIIIEDGFEVVAGGGGSFKVSLDAPNAVIRPPRDPATPFDFSVNWFNDGINDVVPGILDISSSAPISLDPNSISNIGVANNENSTYLFGSGINYYATVESDDLPGILLPGESGSIPIFGLVDPNPDNIFISTDYVHGNELNNPFPWEDIRGQLQPLDMTEEEFEPVFNQLVEQVGSTWGDYLDMLGYNANLLPKNYGARSNASSLISLIELPRARAKLTNSISGVVFTENKSIDVSGTTIVAEGMTTGEIFTTRVLNDGSFIFSDLLIDQYCFNVNGLVIPNQSSLVIDVSEGQTITDLIIPVEDGVSLHAIVRSASSDDVLEGASVIVLDEGRAVATGLSNAQGELVIPNLSPGKYDLLIGSENAAKTLVENVEISEQGGDILVGVEQNSAISGKIVIPDSIVEDDIVVFATRQESNSPINSQFIAFTENGSFKLNGLSEGVYDLNILNTKNNQATEIAGLNIPSGSQIELGEVEILSEIESSESQASGIETSNFNLTRPELLIWHEIALIAGLAVTAAYGWEFGYVYQKYLLNRQPNRGIFKASDGSTTVEGGGFPQGINFSTGKLINTLPGIRKQSETLFSRVFDVAAKAFEEKIREEINQGKISHLCSNGSKEKNSSLHTGSSHVVLYQSYLTARA